MKTQKLTAGWRIGFILGSGLIRVWLGRWIFTIRETHG